jgi:3,4-dihydroxy 2-butanone 4-phosphate synthase/GTP cyclohydrolase II
MSNSTKESILNSIEEAIADIKAGKVVIVVDNEDRENEGDFITAARNVTPEVINFMSKEGRGLICAALTPQRCNELDLPLMVTHNTDPNKTAFTVSVDLLGHGCTTGISAHDRSKTVQALIDPNTQPRDLARPGHIFPLIAKPEGVLRRPGHTEATIDLAKMAGFEPAGVLVEIMNEDGTMARLPQLLEIAEKHNLKIISIEDLIAYRMQSERLVTETTRTPFNNPFGAFTHFTFTQSITQEKHYAFTLGNWSDQETVAVRVHSGKPELDLLDWIQNGENSTLGKGLKKIQDKGKGALVYMHAHHKQEETLPMDDRDYGTGAQIIRALNIRHMHLISNHPVKRNSLNGYGIEIVTHEPLEK